MSSVCARPLRGPRSHCKFQCRQACRDGAPASRPARGSGGRDEPDGAPRRSLGIRHHRFSWRRSDGGGSRRPVDIVLSAIVGAAGLRATAAAIRSGSDIALANKECLICAGSAFMALAREHERPQCLPVDSEHNALYPADRQARSGGYPHLHAHRVGRAVPHLAGGPLGKRDAAAGASRIPPGRWGRRSPSTPRRS